MRECEGTRCVTCKSLFNDENPYLKAKELYLNRGYVGLACWSLRVARIDPALELTREGVSDDIAVRTEGMVDCPVRECLPISTEMRCVDDILRIRRFLPPLVGYQRHISMAH